MKGGIKMTNDAGNLDGYAKVFITGDGMSAYLTVYGPRTGGRSLTMQEVLEVVRGAGVVEGIDINNIAEALKSENWEKSFIVAHGTPPRDGVDGRIEYKISLPDKRGKPVELEDGRVDFRNLNLFTNVARGQLLAVRTPPVAGVPGKTVTGRTVVPKAGKNIPLPRGKNTVANESDTHLYAVIDGHVTMVEGKINVNTVLELSGDVDYSTGNIDYIGNVVVRGNITTGFTVKAGGDIEVNGVIEGAVVIAKGNILVKNGIAGGHKAQITAGGSLFARFVENARVEVEGDVIVSEGIIQSQVKAGNNILVEGRKGVIVGGTLQAVEEITARVIGSSLSPQTILEVGSNPHLREERKQINLEYQEKKKAFDNLNLYLHAYQKSGITMDNLPSKRKLALVQLLSEYKVLKTELEELTARKQLIEQELGRLQKGRVKVSDIAYPGVQITIGQAQFSLNDPIRRALFCLHEGDVKVEPLR